MSYSKKLYQRAVIKLIAIGIAFVLIFFVSSFFTLRDPAKYGVLFVFMLGFFFYPLLKKIGDLSDRITDPIFEDARKAKRGWEGEEEVFNWLEEIVGEEYFLKNAHIPKRIFDFDAMVISEKGVTVLEVKNWTDTVRFEGEKWYTEKEGVCIPMASWRNPISKLKKHTQSLREYLDENGLQDVLIHSAIIFVNGKVSWEGKQRSYIVKDKEFLKHFLKNTPGEGKCTKEIQQKIKSMFPCDKE